MVQLMLPSNFNQQVLAWDDSVVPTNGPSSLLDQYNLNEHKMRKVVMQIDNQLHQRRLLKQ